MSGVPGSSILFSSVQLGTALAAPSTTSLVTIATSAVSLVAGTSYWIVVLPDAGGADEIQWNWNEASPPIWPRHLPVAERATPGLH